MNLDRHNYEEYFILYMDNELGSDDRRQVEDFIQRHPDLKEELDLLMQYKLTPDTNIVFDGKEELMMRNGQAPIDAANYEEWLTSYIDDELTPEKKTEVEQLVAANAQVKKDLELLQQTKLQPEEIVFADKESLYKREEKIRTMSWWKIAAAAVLLFGITTTAIVVLNNKPNKEQDKVSQSQSVKAKPLNDNIAKQSKNEVPVISPVVTNTDQKKNKIRIKEAFNTTSRQNYVASKNKNERHSQIKKNEPVFANDNSEKKKTNELTQPTDNPYVNGLADLNKKEAIVKTIPDELTNSNKKTDNDAVTVAHPESSDLIEQPAGKKGKLRGFLRKVTRTIEKNTNINATDNEDRVLIGGLALKLK